MQKVLQRFHSKIYVSTTSKPHLFYFVLDEISNVFYCCYWGNISTRGERRAALRHLHILLNNFQTQIYTSPTPNTLEHLFIQGQLIVYTNQQALNETNIFQSEKSRLQNRYFLLLSVISHSETLALAPPHVLRLERNYSESSTSSHKILHLKIYTYA